MALPGPAKGLAVATVTYINYPSRRKPKFRRTEPLRPVLTGVVTRKMVVKTLGGVVTTLFWG